MKCAPLGVCVLPEAAHNAPRTSRFGAYIHEILGHAGLCYETLKEDHICAALEAGGSRLAADWYSSGRKGNV